MRSNGATGKPDGRTPAAPKQAPSGGAGEEMATLGGLALSRAISEPGLSDINALRRHLRVGLAPRSGRSLAGQEGV
jgi:hypothetical protein